jgi:hypothetical protein
MASYWNSYATSKITSTSSPSRTLRRLQANKISNEVLATTTFPRWVAIAILLAQFLPILFLLLVAPFNEYMAYQEGG